METVTYKLGEKIGVGNNPMRWVHIQVVDEKGVMTDEAMVKMRNHNAMHLCAIMDEGVSNTPSLSFKHAHHGWWTPMHKTSLPALTHIIARAADQATAWLGRIQCKYIEIRVDMRTGHWLLKNAQGDEASKEIFDMLKESEYRFGRKTFDGFTEEMNNDH